jgi:hypothetical protein
MRKEHPLLLRRMTLLTVLNRTAIAVSAGTAIMLGPVSCVRESSMRLSGPLAPLISSAFASAGELHCLDPATTLACWASSGDTTVYYYAEASGLVTVLGRKQLLDAEQLQQTFESQAAEFMRLHGVPSDCRVGDEQVQERRWRLADHEVVLRAVSPAAGVRARPSLLSVRQLNQSECSDVPEVPYRQ